MLKASDCPGKLALKLKEASDDGYTVIGLLSLFCYPRHYVAASSFGLQRLK